MRKLLLSIVAASMTLAACNAQSGYKVTGTVEGMPDGKAISQRLMAVLLTR